MRSLTRLSDTGASTYAGLSRAGLAVSLLLHAGLAAGVLAAGTWLDKATPAQMGMAGPRVMAVSFVSAPAPETTDLPQPEPVINPERNLKKRAAAKPPVKIAEDALRKAEPVETPPRQQPPKQQPQPAQRISGRDGAAAKGAGRGAVAGQADLHKSYADELLRHIARHKHYPRAAVKRREQGVAVVQFALDGTGRLVSLHLMESSGHRILDRAAMQTLRNAQPLPLPPAPLQKTLDGFTLPVRFALVH